LSSQWKVKHMFRVTLLFFMAWVNYSSAIADTKFVEDIREAREIYLAATDGNKRAVRKALMQFRKLEKRYPGNPLVLAYKGGSLSLRGISNSARPMNRMRDTEEGLVVIDKALRRLAKYQGDYLEKMETQLVAAYTFINIPNDIFHRLREGAHLVKGLLAHPKFSEISPGMQAAIYFAAATVAEKQKNQDKLQHFLTLAVAADPDSQGGRDAQQKLDEAVELTE